MRLQNWRSWFDKAETALSAHNAFLTASDMIAVVAQQSRHMVTFIYQNPWQARASTFIYVPLQLPTISSLGSEPASLSSWLWSSAWVPRRQLALWVRGGSSVGSWAAPCA
jgi:hypothetical protein